MNGWALLRAILVSLWRADRAVFLWFAIPAVFLLGAWLVFVGWLFWRTLA